jgi:SAM-dependent methyltransferase
MFEPTLTIDGRAVAAQATLEVVDPSTGKPFARCPDTSRQQLDEAMAAAQRAFPGWASDEAARRQALVACADALQARADEIARILSQEQGKPLARAVEEVHGASLWFRVTAGLPLAPEVLQDDDERRIELHRKPLGVVGAITPWNFPVILAMWKVAPALLAGNTLVLKPSPYTPLSSLAVGEVLRELLPPGVLNVVSGGDDLGRQVCEHPAVRKISFTGSVATGKKIAAAAADDLKRVTLELGGNDPAVVLGDVDPKRVAEKLFWGAFRNSGQICVAIKRLYVQESIYPALQTHVRRRLLLRAHAGDRRLGRRAPGGRGAVRPGAAHHPLPRRGRCAGAGQRHALRPRRLGVDIGHPTRRRAGAPSRVRDRLGEPARQHRAPRPLRRLEVVWDRLRERPLGAGRLHGAAGGRHRPGLMMRRRAGRLAFRVEPARRRYRLRLARYPHQVRVLAGVLPPGPRAVVDAGCGGGRLPRYWAEWGDPARNDVSFTGIDHSAGRLARCGGLYDRLEQHDISRRWPLCDGHADAVVCEQVLEHFDDRDVAFILDEIHRVLRPGGFALVGVPLFPRGVSHLVGPARRLRTLLGGGHGPGRGHQQAWHLEALRRCLADHGLSPIEACGFRLFSLPAALLEDHGWYYRAHRWLGRRLPSLAVEATLLAQKSPASARRPGSW